MVSSELKEIQKLRLSWFSQVFKVPESQPEPEKPQPNPQCVRKKVKKAPKFRCKSKNNYIIIFIHRLNELEGLET